MALFTVNMVLTPDITPCSVPFMNTTQNSRTAHGTVHILTIGEYGKPVISNRDGVARRRANRVGQAAGKANCGTAVSSAARITDEPANCPKCLAR